MPGHGEYTENPACVIIHDPEFRPYMYEFLLPEKVQPKGAVIPSARAGITGLCDP